MLPLQFPFLVEQLAKCMSQELVVRVKGNGDPLDEACWRVFQHCMRGWEAGEWRAGLNVVKAARHYWWWLVGHQHQGRISLHVWRHSSQALAPQRDTGLCRPPLTCGGVGCGRVKNSTMPAMIKSEECELKQQTFEEANFSRQRKEQLMDLKQQGFNFQPSLESICLVYEQHKSYYHHRLQALSNPKEFMSIIINYSDNISQISLFTPNLGADEQDYPFCLTPNHLQRFGQSLTHRPIYKKDLVLSLLWNSSSCLQQWS